MEVDLKDWYWQKTSLEFHLDMVMDLDHGSRFEGLVLAENKFGIPFGYGEMYDDDG